MKMKKYFLLVVFWGLLVGGQPAWADDKAAVQQALDHWVAAISDGSAERVSALYAEEAILLPTLSNQIRYTNESISSYMVKLTALKDLKAIIDTSNTRIYGDTAISSGQYTFTFKEDGNLVELPTRFTFVYQKIGDDWLIIEHHSSLMPE